MNCPVCFNEMKPVETNDPYKGDLLSFNYNGQILESFSCECGLRLILEKGVNWLRALHAIAINGSKRIDGLRSICGSIKCPEVFEVVSCGNCGGRPNICHFMNLKFVICDCGNSNGGPIFDSREITQGIVAVSKKIVPGPPVDSMTLPAFFVSVEVGRRLAVHFHGGLPIYFYDRPKIDGKEIKIEGKSLHGLEAKIGVESIETSNKLCEEIFGQKEIEGKIDAVVSLESAAIDPNSTLADLRHGIEEFFNAINAAHSSSSKEPDKATVSSPSELGTKDKAGKPDMSLIPALPLLDMAKLYTRGAQEYGPRNWEKGFVFSDALSALERHLTKFKLGENLDPKTRRYHLTHVAWYCFAIVEFMARERSDLDDRNGFVVDEEGWGPSWTMDE